MKTKHYRYECLPGGGLRLESYDPDAKQALFGWAAAGSGIPGLGADESCLYGFPGMSYKVPRKMKPGMSKADYELWGWELKASAARKLAAQITKYINNTDYYKPSERPVARELLGILKKCGGK